MSGYHYSLDDNKDGSVTITAYGLQAALYGTKIIQRDNPDFKIIPEMCVEYVHSAIPMYEIVLKGSSELLIESILSEIPDEPDWPTLKDCVTIEELREMAKGMDFELDGRAHKVETLVDDFRKKYFRKYK